MRGRVAISCTSSGPWSRFSRARPAGSLSSLCACVRVRVLACVCACVFVCVSVSCYLHRSPHALSATAAGCDSADTCHGLRFWQSTFIYCYLFSSIILFDQTLEAARAIEAGTDPPGLRHCRMDVRVPTRHMCVCARVYARSTRPSAEADGRDSTHSARESVCTRARLCVLVLGLQRVRVPQVEQHRDVRGQPLSKTNKPSTV